MSTQQVYIILVIMLAIQILFQQSDSTAVITTEGSLRERNDFECGTSVAIICRTQSTPNKVVLTIDNVWVADCTFGFCTENISIPAFYTFNLNATEGVFHLNIQPVSFQQNGKIFACEENSVSSDNLTAEVNVLPDTSTAIDTTSNTQLIVTTGCVYPVTDITFEWYIYQVGKEAVLYTKQKPVQTFNDSGCSLGDCGHTEAARVSSTLNIPSVKTGDLYFFQVIVRRAATSMVEILNSTIKYRINVSGDLDGSNGNGTHWLYILLSIFAVIVAIIPMISLVINGKPKPVKEFSVATVTNSSITVTWKRDSKYCCQPKYILECLEKEEVLLMDTTEEYDFLNLSAKTRYNFKIHEETCIGISEQKSTLAVTTKGKPDPPTGFGVIDSGVTNTTIAVQWKPGANGGFKQTFTLNCAQNEMETKNLKNMKENNNNVMYCMWTHLSEGTMYKITIVARNEAGTTQLEPLHVRTLD